MISRRDFTRVHEIGNVIVRTAEKSEEPEDSVTEWSHLRGVQLLQERYEQAAVAKPYFRSRSGPPKPESSTELIDFSSYNYLGLCGHPEVNEAAIRATQKYGTSASASRLVGGQLSIHTELEAELADFCQEDEVMVFTSGHATNVSTIPLLVESGDMVIHDDFCHDSILRGVVASRAKRFHFVHNDLDALERVLQKKRASFKNALVVVEGLYSMDGDYLDLRKLTRLQEEYDLTLMIDEAHSFGVLGATGRGISERFGLKPKRTVWMGTLSKALASCGGFIAADRELVQYLKHTAPGFVYSCGMPPATAGAALAALRLLRREPWRLEQLRENSTFFRECLLEAGLRPGGDGDSPIIPLAVGESNRALGLNEELFAAGVSASAILYPAVPKSASRLRFFMTFLHTKEQLERAARVVASVLGT